MMLAHSNAAVADLDDVAADAAGSDARVVPEKTRRAKPAAKAVPLALRVVSGFHNGAARALERRDVLMIGNATDCDVILADAGVGRHHCLIARNGNKLSVRAVDSALSVDNQTVSPGEPLPVKPGARISIGEATLSVVVTSDAPPQGAWNPPNSAAEAAASIAQTWRGAPWWATALLAVTVGGAVLWTTQGLWFVDEGPHSMQAPEVDAVVKSMGIGDEVAVREKPGGKMVVQGVVPDAHAETQLRDKLKTDAPEAVVQVRSGPEVADDVSEILRLKGIDATANYEGQGQVRVHGHLGDEGALSSTIQSRAMRDIQGLKKVIAVNLDRSQPPARNDGPKSKRVISVAGGRDPYLVTADGSRYYVGAQLPGGSRLVAVEGSEIVLDSAGKTERRTGVGSLLGATP